MTTTCNSCTNPLNQFCWTTSTIPASRSNCSSKTHFFQNTTHNSLHLAQFSWRKSLVFTKNTLSFKILKLIALLCTLTHHMGKHLSHSFTISNQSFSIKGNRWAFLFWSNGCQHWKQRQSQSQRSESKRRRTGRMRMRKAKDRNLWWDPSHFFCLEMESVWPKSTNAYTPSLSYGRCMWRYSSLCFSWLDLPC